MFDKVKYITLKINSLFPMTELGIHVNNVFCGMKETNVCFRKKKKTKMQLSCCEKYPAALKVKSSRFTGIHT